MKTMTLADLNLTLAQRTHLYMAEKFATLIWDLNRGYTEEGDARDEAACQQYAWSGRLPSGEFGPYGHVEQALMHALRHLVAESPLDPDGGKAAQLREYLASNGESVEHNLIALTCRWLGEEAREHGHDSGHAHENFVTAYGREHDTPVAVPDRFALVAGEWQSAFEDGREEYRAERDEM